ncbi:MAG: shikimate kinase [Tissierellia bacterium]|nr:shikimate kinase [Tissierellia bacterium]
MNNIILIGMPGSGKSTVGRAIAKKLDLEFLDIDTMVVEREGKEIRRIFEEDGEAHFREVEHLCVLEAAKAQGVIISTGGGTILREDSVAALRASGQVFWLNRPLEELIPTDERPLGDTREKIEALYHQRYSLYEAAAHVEVVGETAEDAAEKIVEYYREGDLPQGK